MGKLKNIRHLGVEEIKQVIKELHEPEFRARQVSEWIWKKSVTDFNQMKNIPLRLRNNLIEAFEFCPAKIEKKLESDDGSIKYLFKLHDNQMVEGVLIPSGTRVTACVSTQVGCPLKCKFCATGKMSFKRNLAYDEIYDQVVLINQDAINLFNKRLSNIVYMGMGEPLLNYDNVIESVNKITNEDGLGFAARRITISTAGIAKKIIQLANSKIKVELAVSLNFANNEKRAKLMPINETYSLEKLKASIEYYYEKTKNLVTIEYIFFEGINDTDEDVIELKNFTRGLLVKINLIEYNPVAKSEFKISKKNSIVNFGLRLEKSGYIVNIRRSKGKDINAACGQLAGGI